MSARRRPSPRALTREQREVLAWFQRAAAPRPPGTDGYRPDRHVVAHLCRRGLLAESTFGWVVTDAGRAALGDED